MMPATVSSALRRTETRHSWVPVWLLFVYLLVWSVLAVSPVDRKDWLLENILAIASVLGMVMTYRRFAFSDVSYTLITLFLLLHAVGAHYTYAQAPIGFWMKDVFDLSRNHFDRIVHFSFGLLLTYPASEVFRRAVTDKTGWALGMAVTLVTSMSGLFEVIESWVAQLTSPELGEAYLGTQGDVWDAQKDMTMAIVGALMAVGIIAAIQQHRSNST